MADFRVQTRTPDSKPFAYRPYMINGQSNVENYEQDPKYADAKELYE